jgi:hypothetical protein
MTMKDVAAQASVHLSVEQMTQFDSLTKDFADIVSDPVYYRLTTLLALTRQTRCDHDQCWSQSQDRCINTSC